MLKYLGLALTMQLCFALAALAQLPALAPLPGTGSLSTPANTTQFTFVLAGDNRPAHKKCPQPPTPGKIFSAVKQMSPAAAFVLWTGDTISGKQPDKPKTMGKQYEEFLGIATTAGVPVFNAPGNHEMDDENNAPSTPMKKLYEKYMSSTYGGFTYGNSRFIALDSEHEPSKSKPAATNKSKSEAPGAISQKELELLKEDLDADKNLAHVFIFMHHPVEPYSEKDGLDAESVKALKKLFKNYSNVSYVVSGHEHLYYNSQGDPKKKVDPPSRNDPSQPPYYLVSGGAGAPLKKNTPGSFFHYMVFNVDGNKVSPTLVPVDSTDPCDK
ncbi:MAG TPA: metallophosphoesterase [Candidatus Angelobacter sp.]